MRYRAGRIVYWSSFFAVILCLTVSCGEVSESDQRVLPIWATPEELGLTERIVLPALPGSPPPSGFRTPAEYELARVVLMTWAGYQDMLTDIAGLVAGAGVEVWMVGGPASLSGVPADRYRALNIAYNSVWIRDYGPFGIQEETGGLGIVDTTYRHFNYRKSDDKIPCNIADDAGVDCYGTSLIMDGGNFMTDGRGNLFMTERTYIWNAQLTTDQVDRLLMDYFNVDNIHVFAYARDQSSYPADGTGHIDMFAKLLGECTVLVAESNQAPYTQPLQEAAEYFSKLECAPDQYYQVVRIPGWEDQGVWYTYTNALIVNQTVIVPSYSGADNQAARQIYQVAMPGYAVELVDSDDSIRAGGSIHCLAREIPRVLSDHCMDPGDCNLPQVAQHDCVQGQCTVKSCDAGYRECNGVDIDGCETKLGTVWNCSGCGDACGEGETCDLDGSSYICITPCQPTDEVCNDKDDDCDGETDEDGVCEQKHDDAGCNCKTSGQAPASIGWYLLLALLGLAARKP